jgi:hypothetical protein
VDGERDATGTEDSHIMSQLRNGLVVDQWHAPFVRHWANKEVNGDAGCRRVRHGRGGTWWTEEEGGEGEEAEKGRGEQLHEGIRN